MDNKKSVPLIAVFAIPVILIITVVILISFPRMFSIPETDFLFYIDSELKDRKTSQTVEFKNALYTVEDGNLIFDKSDILNNSDSTLYYFDIKSMTASKISVSNALNLQLDPSKKSPNGYQIRMGRKSVGVFPFSVIQNNNVSTYLKNDYTSYKMDLGESKNLTIHEIKLIGWIKK